MSKIKRMAEKDLKGLEARLMRAINGTYGEHSEKVLTQVALVLLSEVKWCHEEKGAQDE